MTTSSTRPVLEVEGLCIDYVTDRAVVHAVRNASFSVGLRESMGLVGESGSGKSTLVMGAIGYLPDNGRITAGRVLLNGRDLAGMRAAERRKVWASEIGVVYQSPLGALNPSIRIGKQLAEVSRFGRGRSANEARRDAIEMLNKVAMPDPESVMDRYPHQLSGGMLQRCVIAMALMTNPSLLIMDEPTTALDVTTQAVVLDLVSELEKQLDTAIVYITHDLAVVAHVCDWVSVMYAGELVEQAPIADLYQRPNHPYTLDLLGCMPRLDFSSARHWLRSIPGSIPDLDEVPEGCVYSPRCGFGRTRCAEEKPELALVRGGRAKAACFFSDEVPAVDSYYSESTHRIPDHQPSGPQKLLSVASIRKEFPARSGAFGKGSRTVKAVDDISLNLSVGETLGVVGESGSGKTTLARMIVGLETPTGGTMELRSDKLAGSAARRPRELLQDIQMVFQNPTASLNPSHTVGAAIGRPLRRVRQVGRGAVRAKVGALLESVQLPAHYAERLPSELSGGEKQRVAIARAFAADPALIVCDEPISSLDVSVQSALLNLLIQLQLERQVAYIFISHDLAAVQHISNWIAVMYLGCVVEWGPTAKVLAAPFHPYTEALISAVPNPAKGECGGVRLGGTVPSAIEIPAGCRFHPRCPRRIDRCSAEVPPLQRNGRDHWMSCHIGLDELARLQAVTPVAGGRGCGES